MGAAFLPPRRASPTNSRSGKGPFPGGRAAGLDRRCLRRRQRQDLDAIPDLSMARGGTKVRLRGTPPFGRLRASSFLARTKNASFPNRKLTVSGKIPPPLTSARFRQCADAHAPGGAWRLWWLARGRHRSATVSHAVAKGVWGAQLPALFRIILFAELTSALVSRISFFEEDGALRAIRPRRRKEP